MVNRLAKKFGIEEEKSISILGKSRMIGKDLDHLEEIGFRYLFTTRNNGAEHLHYNVNGERCIIQRLNSRNHGAEVRYKIINQ